MPICVSGNTESLPSGLLPSELSPHHCASRTVSPCGFFTYLGCSEPLGQTPVNQSMGLYGAIWTGHTVETLMLYHTFPQSYLYNIELHCNICHSGSWEVFLCEQNQIFLKVGLNSTTSTCRHSSGTTANFCPCPLLLLHVPWSPRSFPGPTLSPLPSVYTAVSSSTSFPASRSVMPSLFWVPLFSTPPPGCFLPP